VDCHNVLFLEEAIEASKGAGITTLHEFNPENNKTCMGVTPAHIGNKLNLVRGMLFRVVVRSAGTVAEGLHRDVEASLPSVNVLSVLYHLYTKSEKNFEQKFYDYIRKDRTNFCNP